MGKIRLKTIGDEGLEEAEKAKKAIKKAEKLSRAKSARGETAQDESASGGNAHKAVEQTESIEPASQGVALEAQEKKLSKAKSAYGGKTKFAKKSRGRSSNYSAKVLEIDKNKTYSLTEALELLKKVHLAKFDETVELHINTTEAGINGNVKLPHGTGKEIRVAVADDALLSEIEKGKINFDILIATPVMMPKLGRVAKVLGPKGLMPNPKNGTISENPEEALKKFQGGQVSFKTESKIPLIHLIVGKMSFGDEKLSENINTMLKAIKKDRITKVVLKSTMSPAIRLTV